jgi:hypothetical protein
MPYCRDNIIFKICLYCLSDFLAFNRRPNEQVWFRHKRRITGGYRCLQLEQCLGSGFHRRLIDLDEREALSWLYGLRVKADYAGEHVDNDEASEAAEVARRLVQRLVGLEDA